MIVKGNPGLGIQSTYDQAQTEKIGYANATIAITRSLRASPLLACKADTPGRSP